MKKLSETSESLREKIIGLGEHSIRKHYYTSLQEQFDELERFRALLDQSKEMIFLGLDGCLMDVNQTASSFYKLPKEKMLGSTYESVFPACITNKIAYLFEEAKYHDALTLETQIKKTPIEFTLQIILFRHVPYVVLFGTDITKRKEAEEEIHRLGNYDPLTHLPNKNMLNERLFGLKQSCSKGQNCGASCQYLEGCKYSALLLIDLDHFKELNDTEGHNQGDVFLKELARRLGDLLSRGDFLCRFGGDEFIVLMESLHVELSQTISIVESFAYTLKTSINQPISLGHTTHLCSSSIGVVIFRKGQTGDVIKQAEIAMYEAKNSGRNTIRFYDPKMQEAIKHKVSIETSLRRALKKNALELYYQPKVDATQKIIALEALIRWHHLEQGFIPPSEFIPLAEENGLIIPLGAWVIKTACLQLARWSLDEKTSSLTIAVNLSIKQLQSEAFIATIERILEATKCPKEKLIFEITETLFMGDVDAMVSKMHQIKSMGIRFSIDDFGTGYSSLSAIKKIPLDELKIDQSFTQDIKHHTDEAVIIHTIVGMAKNLGLRVVAEGVETKEQFTFLKRAGCHVFQGYLFSKPLPLEALEKIL
ncbi:MAG: EAL domain-containing protein [Campylobacterales bacterium]|nr:EAL domain-containing protein [Campylobacterales bacterium]